ncbi:MAG: hypothetical protein Q7R85_00970 [bacterium]|nr:hypothetical protein [bacterium]
MCFCPSGQKEDAVKKSDWVLLVAGIAFLALLIPPLVRQTNATREKVQAYDALMAQASSGAPPDAILAVAYEELNRGMTEDQVRKAVEKRIKSWVVSSSRTKPPDNVEAEVRLIWRRYGEHAQKNHSCEELNVDLGADGLVTPGGVIYVGNYTLNGKSKPQLWKQK